MRRRTFTHIVASAALIAAHPASRRRAAAAEPLKVGFIYVGPVGDFGWSYDHDQARKALQDHYGDKIRTTYVESVPEGPDSENVLRDLAAKDHKLIFATSFCCSTCWVATY